MRRRSTWLLVPLLAATGIGLFAPAGAPASCVGPSLEVPGVPTGSPVADPSTGQVLTAVRLSPGQQLTVRGSYFFDGCNDTSDSSPGCSGPQVRSQDPSRDVHLVLTQGSRSWDLGTADATGPQYAVSWPVTLPSDLAAGGATLTARLAGLPVEVLDAG